MTVKNIIKFFAYYIVTQQIKINVILKSMTKHNKHVLKSALFIIVFIYLC